MVLLKRSDGIGAAAAPSPTGRDADRPRGLLAYIRSRMDLKFIMLVVALSAVGGGSTVWLAAHQLSESVRENLVQRATNVAVSMAGSATHIVESQGRDRGAEALLSLVAAAQEIIANDTSIDYVAGMDRTGRALFHSDPARIGRVFDDPVGRAAANSPVTLVQLYPRDTGQLMYDVAVPLFAFGEHWGVIRVGIDTEAIEAARRSIVVPVAILATLGIFGAFVLTVLATQRLVRPLRSLVDATQRLAAGDLTVQVETDLTDEVGSLARAFNSMVQTLQGLVAKTAEVAHEMAEHSEHLAGASSQSTEAVHDIARQMERTHEAAARQDEQIRQTEAAMKQLTSAVDQIAAGSQEQANETADISILVERAAEAMASIAEEAERVLEFAESSALTARDGGEALREAMQGLMNIQSIVVDAAARMQKLDEHSAQITRMVDMIADIAEQTSLLSLNAAIEAARAGHEGRGFAVVAEEVRKLADRSAAATGEISDVVQRIRSEIADAVGFMNEGVTRVNEHAESAKHAESSLQAIVRRVDEARDYVESITKSANQVAEQSRNAVRSVQNVNAITEEAAAATEEIAASATEVLHAIAEVAEGIRHQRQRVDEASAAAAEVAASMEEVSRASDALSASGQQLQTLTRRFRVS